MINADRDAMRELLELAAVPAQSTLTGLLGRKASVQLKEIKEVSAETMTNRLPHFSIIVENSIQSEKERAHQLFVMEKEEAQHLIGGVCGFSNASRGVMDEVSVSAFREVLSQCLETAVRELSDFLDRSLKKNVGEASLSDSAGMAVRQSGGWMGTSVLFLLFSILPEGMGEYSLYCVTSMELFNLFGMEYMPQKAESGPAKPAIPVRSVSFPEFKYMSPEVTVGEIGEDRTRIREMGLDVSVRIGETICTVRNILDLAPGQTLVLDKQAGAPADVVAKDRLIGKGDVLVSGDNFAVRITEIVNKTE